MKNLHLANTFYGFVFNCKQCYSAYASNVLGKKRSNIYQPTQFKTYLQLLFSTARVGQCEMANLVDKTFDIKSTECIEIHMHELWAYKLEFQAI